MRVSIAGRAGFCCGVKRAVKFAELKSSKTVSDKIKKLLISSYDKNKQLFGRAPNKKFKIVICNSQEEWKKESKYYYYPWGAGTVLRDMTLVVKGQKFLKRSDRKYKTLLDHEMNHVFFGFFYKTTKPAWILEGLASTIEGPLLENKSLKKVKWQNISYKILQYRYLERNFQNKKDIMFMYSVWRDFILYLTGNKPKMIVRFMDSYIKNPTKANYKKLFYKFFGGTEKEKFESFLE